MFDILDGIMSMSLDLYKQVEKQDPDTGSVKREFIFYKTLPCHARGKISETASRSIDRSTMSNKYTNEQYVEIRTSDRITARDKIVNIRDSDGKPIWYELNYPSETPTVFEVIGTTPIMDPFGLVLGYNTSLRRSENQQIGI